MPRAKSFASAIVPFFSNARTSCNRRLVTSPDILTDHFDWLCKANICGCRMRAGVERPVVSHDSRSARGHGLFGVHRNIVREWVKRGLPTSDDRRPS
jgi:hypothetical protein